MQTHFSSHPENDEKGTVVRCPRSWLVPIRAAWNKQKRNEICECSSQDRHITMISEGCEHVICLPSDNVTLKIENTNCAKEPQYDSKPHYQRVFPAPRAQRKKQKKRCAIHGHGSSQEQRGKKKLCEHSSQDRLITKIPGGCEKVVCLPSLEQSQLQFVRRNLSTILIRTQPLDYPPLVWSAPCERCPLSGPRSAKLSRCPQQKLSCCVGAKSEKFDITLMILICPHVHVLKTTPP